MAAEPEAHKDSDALRQKLCEREGEIALLLETGRMIGSELDLDTVFHAIAERARLLIKAETVLVPLLNAEKTAYTYRAGTGRNVEEIVGQTLPIDFGLCGWVLRNERPWWRGALSELSEAERNLWEHEAGTVILVPLVGRHSFLGGLAGIDKQGGSDFTQRDLALLELFAAQAAIAIENAMTMEKAEQSRLEAEESREQLQRLYKQLHAANIQLEQMALFDPLTHLPNRTLFRDRVNHEIRTVQAHTRQFAILFVDLDNFQDINNSYGHETGDLLLRAVAEQLDEMLGPNNTLSRMSGDEFAALLSGFDEAKALDVGRAMNQLLLDNVSAGQQRISLSASIGIAIYPQHGSDLSTLMKHADLAMNSAKRDRAGTRVFEAERDSAVQGRYALIQNLRDALEHKEFVLHYQPKLDLAGNSISSCEALARWPHPQRGMVPPDMFITALEQTNLILPFTRWVITTAAQQHLEWHRLDWNIDIAVNVPPMVLMNPEFLAWLDAQPSLAGLTFEITENVFLGDLDTLDAVMTRLRGRGIALSIDDFGTGYSSLPRLRQTPVDEIKIDRSFVKDMLNNKDDEIIVRSTIELARNLGLHIVGEGVENVETFERLRSLGCNNVQGYHICRPLPLPELEAFLRKSPWPVRQLRLVQASA